MAHSVSTDEILCKVDCTRNGCTTDESSSRLMASGFTPPHSKEAEISSLRLANCELQARLSGYLVLRKCSMLILTWVSFHAIIWLCWAFMVDQIHLNFLLTAVMCAAQAWCIFSYFLARDSIQHICLARYMLSPARPSVRWVDHRKTVEVRIMKLSPYGSPSIYFLQGKFHPEIRMRSPRARASHKGGVGKISIFQSLSVNISKTVADTAKVPIND